MIHFKVRNKYFINVETKTKTLNTFFSKNCLSARYLKNCCTNLRETLNTCSTYQKLVDGQKDFNFDKKFFLVNKKRKFLT